VIAASGFAMAATPAAGANPKAVRGAAKPPVGASPAVGAARPAAAQAALAVPPGFGHTVNLGPAKGDPSIQDDGQGRLYITTPVSLLSRSNGVLLSRSTDGGQTFLSPQAVGGIIGGADSDVVSDVSTAHVWVSDLGVAFTTVFPSTDHGVTFPSNTLAGPDDDREWLTTIGPTLFLTYHDFALGIPLIFISTDGGATFLPGGLLGQIISPTQLGFVNSKCNTQVSKPVTDVAGTIYILINASTPAEYAASACATPSPLDVLYMSVSKDGGHTFTNTKVADISAAATGKPKSGSFGHRFDQLAIDNGGNLYIDGTATLDGNLPLQNYLMVSKDQGATFSAPIPTNAGANGQVLPSIAVGQAGQVAVGYFQGGKPDHGATGNNFQFAIDQSLNATAAVPTFTHMQLPNLSGTTVHPDGICTDGNLCTASSTGNRNLGDFASMTLDPTGNLEVVIPADSNGTVTENWFYKQTAGAQMPPGPTNGNGTGNQSWVAGARTLPPPQPPPTTPDLSLPTTTRPTAARPDLRAVGLPLVMVAALVVGVAWRPRGRRRRHQGSG
jgi:hypothetical protein